MAYIVKESGDKELFSEEKYRRSLRRAQVDQSHIDKIVTVIQPYLYDGMTTAQLYTKTYELLKKFDRSCAGRYSLKQGLRDFGPTGFPFENFIARLFEHQGFQTEVGLTVQGFCIPHEIDVVAYSSTRCYVVECKFHVHPGERVNVHVPLYVKSRFEDIAQAHTRVHGHILENLSQVWIVTNTKLSEQAIQFIACKKMNALGWGYPQHASLEALIKKYELYPITVLTLLKKGKRALLLKRGIVLCKDIEKNKHVLKELRLSAQVIAQLIEEAKNICA
jgi:hypothetical protein